MFESICNDRFFLSAFRPRTDIKNKTVTRCYAARHRFFQTRSLPAFSLSSGKLWWFFLTKTVLPILLISPHDVISCLHPFGPQDKRNGWFLKIETIVLHQLWWPYALGIVLIPEFHRVPTKREQNRGKAGNYFLK